MTDRPIIFSGAMVRALLEGRKTQTRRILKLPTKGEYVRPDMGGWEATTVGGEGCFFADGSPAPGKVAIWNQTTGTCVATTYQPGDLLSVRENFHLGKGYDGAKPSDASPHSCVWHAADNTTWMGQGKCRPSIHMPRWASRLTLVVTEVRVQRLQDISDADAIAEGIMRAPQASAGIVRFCLDGWDWKDWKTSARDAFHSLWFLINGPDAWDANPWVVAITFDVHHCNIDQMKEVA